LLSGFFDLQAARDNYRVNVGSIENMNKDLILRFIEVQAMVMVPITPHFSEYMWKLLCKVDFL
jgi:leucyl-tRNA synthetase